MRRIGTLSNESLAQRFCDYLVTLVEMCYQSFGYRRVKNPRIWSMHDLNVLTDRGTLRR